MVTTACPAGDDGAAGDSDTGTSSSDASGTTDEATSADSGTGADTTTGAPEVSGEEFFLSVCASCHGNEGEGTALGYELQHPVRDYSAWVVRHGRPADNPELPGSVMVAYSIDTLSDATLEEIWDYLDAFPQPTTGEALYFDYCRNCHGEDALGGVTGVNVREPGALAELSEKVRQGENVGNYGARTESMPAFDDSRLSDAEVQLIADHIASL
jgi:mono/diheme cytochrome c family protein